MIITRIKGFTIVEILIALIISSILILIASQIISGFNKIYYSNKTDWIKNNDLIEIARVLNYDMERCDFALRTGNNEITLTGKNNIRYLFRNDAIIRYLSDSQDSLASSCTNLRIETIQPDSIISEISFEIEYKNAFYPVVSVKKYGESELYNYQILRNEY